eukprot:6712121-Ditylum_brightwellii.AAC.1
MLSYNPIANVARFCSAPGTISYQTLLALMDAEQDIENFKKVSLESFVVSSNKTEHVLQMESPILCSPCRAHKESMIDLVEFEDKAAKHTSNVHSHDDMQMAVLTPQAELLEWHYNLGHFPFSKLRLLCAL